MGDTLFEKKVIYAVTGGAVGLMSLSYYYVLHLLPIGDYGGQQQSIAFTLMFWLPSFVPVILMAVASWLAEQPNGGRRLKRLLITVFVIFFGGPLVYDVLWILSLDSWELPRPFYSVDFWTQPR